MAEVRSFIFNFIRVDKFLDDINRSGCFDTEDMDGVTNNYRIILATSCPDALDDCLTSEGHLNSSVVPVTNIGDDTIALSWSRQTNGDRVLSLGQTTMAIDIGDVAVPLKGVFLVDGTSGYVLAGSILDKPFTVTNEIIFPLSGVIWNFRNEA